MKRLINEIIRWHGKAPAWMLTAVITAAILWLTLARTPLPETDLPIFPGADKVVHAIMFGSLAIAIWLDWHATIRRALTPWQNAACALISILLGGAIEIAQGAMANGRSADIWDFVADSIGAILAILLMMRHNT